MQTKSRMKLCMKDLAVDGLGFTSRIGDMEAESYNYLTSFLGEYLDC